MAYKLKQKKREVISINKGYDELLQGNKHKKSKGQEPHSKL